MGKGGVGSKMTSSFIGLGKFQTVIWKNWLHNTSDSVHRAIRRCVNSIRAVHYLSWLFVPHADCGPCVAPLLICLYYSIIGNCVTGPANICNSFTMCISIIYTVANSFYIILMIYLLIFGNKDLNCYNALFYIR